MGSVLDVSWHKIAEWQRYTWLRHGFTVRAGGSTTVYSGGGAPELNLGLTAEDDPERVRENRRLAVEALAGGQVGLATVRQVHGVAVLAVKQAGSAGEADGMITATPGLVLGIMVADCVPILMADVRRRIVGAFHAGWRGTAAGMAGVAVERMRAQGAEPADLVAAVGPSIGPCCYGVGEEVRRAFPGGVYHDAHLDLWESNRRQLVLAGVPAENVTVVGECTACTRLPDGGRKYFSYRAEGGITGRAMGLIASVGEDVRLACGHGDRLETSAVR